MKNKKLKSESIRVANEYGGTHIESMLHVESLDFGRSNARIMKNSRGYFLAIDRNGQTVCSSEFAIKIADSQAEKVQKLQGNEQFEYLHYLSEL